MNRNHTQSCQCSRQTQFPSLLGSWLIHRDMLSSVSTSCLHIFKVYFENFQEIFSKKISSKIFENFENFFGKF